MLFPCISLCWFVYALRPMIIAVITLPSIYGKGVAIDDGSVMV